jgi:hypothetical protein
MKKPLLLSMITLLLRIESVCAHEIFSPRADLARTNGLNVDALIKHTRIGNGRETEYLNRIMYGVTEYLTIEARLPIFLEKRMIEVKPDRTLSSCKAAGLGKIQIGAKFRVYHNYGFQKRDQALLFANIFLPTARKALTAISHQPIIDNNSIDFMVGAAGAFESTTFYHFVSTAYRLNNESRSIQVGDQFLYSYAFGYRPEPPDVDKVDWVFLIDIDGVWTGKTGIHRCKLNNSGRHIIFAGPSFFRSLGNFMIKGSMQAPLFQSINGNQQKVDYRFLVAAFLQF